MTLKFEIIKKSLDDPTFTESFGYFYDTRAPSSDDDDYVNSISFGNNFLVYWWDQSGNDIYFLTNWGNTPLVWEKFVTDLNLASSIGDIGWGINSSRNYMPRSSPAFNTSYSTSATNDTQVLATISLTSTLSTAAQVNIQIDSGSGFVSICEESLSELDATSTRSVNFTVPSGSSYKLVNNSGTASIIQIMELMQ